MSSLLELIGLLSYIIIIVLVLTVVFIRSNADDRRVLVSVAFIFSLIIISIFTYIPIIQFLLLILVIISVFYLMFVHILPLFYARRDRILFTEITAEVWDDLKVNETLVEEKN